MPKLSELFANNRRWAADRTREEPDFFTRLTAQQAPTYLWIGCSDSRVPANEIVDLPPGELFVHRNVANVVVHTDLNCLSVMQFAVAVLKVEHIIVCGHYGCSGVSTAVKNERVGLADNWLRHVQDVHAKHERIVSREPDVLSRIARVCELNVIEQVANVCQTTIVRDAWERGQEVNVHGWVYGLKDGLLRDLNTSASKPSEVGPAYQKALTAL